MTIFYVQWAVLTFVFFLTSFKARSWGVMSVLGFLTLAFIFLAAGELSPKARIGKIAGYISFFTALAAMYTGLGDFFFDDVKFRIPLI